MTMTNATEGGSGDELLDGLLATDFCREAAVLAREWLFHRTPREAERPPMTSTEPSLLGPGLSEQLLSAPAP